LCEKKDYSEAARLVGNYLDSNFDDPNALFLLGFCFMQTNSIGLAYQAFKASADIFPGEPATWHNIGKLYHEVQKDDIAADYFRKALKCKPNFQHALAGLAMTNLNAGDYRAAIMYANRALAEDPEDVEAKTNRGMSYLALKRWREGWVDYQGNCGEDKNRQIFTYGKSVMWNGEKGLDLVISGEQGIGDEISFASIFNEAIRDSKSVTIECDGRLEKLFKRSFPTTDVHGTRYKKTTPPWRSEKKYDAHCPMGRLPMIYRNKDEDFHGEPYLVPDPEKVVQWKALLESLGPKPRIGISWTGGLPHTGQKRRSVTLDTYAPLFKAVDAHWISLQYKEPEVGKAEDKYGIKIHDWDWGTRTFDYDQTVALISQLDLVISVCTTVVHAAGGLGKETWCLVPEHPLWRYMDEGEWFPWAKSVTLYRQKGREWPIHLLAGKLKDKFK